MWRGALLYFSIFYTYSVYLSIFLYTYDLFLLLLVFFFFFIFILLLLIIIIIGLVGRVFAYSPGDRGSILSRVIPNTQKMVLDVAFRNTQNYKVRIKGKME